LWVCPNQLKGTFRWESGPSKATLPPTGIYMIFALVQKQLDISVATLRLTGATRCKVIESY
jgi:hypothetical protein